ncbi:hypothetical protein SAMN05444921_122115 [Streptomyces wuyuanensis]|uniref:Uncharacterized protein n=1 Tax=Streptomyces wuyuanensis TaxID=1196353 RepID=A0A1G9ZT53_9ACTN|nr:hypothetical protein SAMN05444921_122115 [Streptomyces wuyuanensis]
MLGSAGEWVQIVGTARVPKGRLSANRRALPPLPRLPRHPPCPIRRFRPRKHRSPRR